jgi:hypothetical protein
LRNYADAALLLRALEAQLAFNVGAELGIVAGRQDALARVARSPMRGTDALRRALKALDGTATTADSLLGLIEAAWALAAGPATLPSVEGRKHGGRLGRNTASR